MDVMFPILQSQTRLPFVIPVESDFLCRHEVVGVVKEVGSDVDDFKVGQAIGVGCMVHSCHSCESCGSGLEQFCPRVVWTYNAVDQDGNPTYGGYSGELVCDRK